MSEAPTPTAASPLRTSTVVLAGLLLTLSFMVLRFPYERLADRIVEDLERRSGAQLQLGPTSLGLVRWGPGLRAEGVRVKMPSGSRVDFESVGLRPALALSWLAGRPALATELAGPLGRARGVLTLGPRGGFRGRLEQVVLGRLPAELLSGPVQLDGVADATVDLRGGEQGSEGSVVFEAREGMLQHPQIPLPLPFQKLDGDIELGGEAMATVRRLELESPLASGRVTGTVARAASFDQAALDLDVELTVSGPVRGSLNAQGVQVGRDGQIRMNVLGTPAAPILR